MKTIKTLVIVFGILAVLSCRMAGQGPIHIEATYPGQFYLVVGMDGPAGDRHEVIQPSPTITYSGDFYAGEELWFIGVYAHKRPPEVAVPVDLGILEVTVTGDFSTLHGIALLGDWAPIGLSKSWDHY